jgi:hypothetical protein
MSYNQLNKAVHAAWKQRLQDDRREPWLASVQLRYGEPLFRRFQHYYQILSSLPRRTRRRVQRKLAMSLATAALLLALSGAPVSLTVNASSVTGDTQIAQVRTGGRGGELGRFSIEPQEKFGSAAASDPALPKGPAAIIVVNGNNSGTDCTLDDAIIAANTDTATGNCTAGTGDDILDIQVNVNLTAPAPVISSTMTVEGNGNTIAGDDTFGPLLSVNATGDMTLNNTTVSNGNSATFGGGVYILNGSATISNSTLSYNYAADDGGGLSNNAGSVVITNTQVFNNGAYDKGGGIDNAYGQTTISSSTIVGNTASYGAGIRNEAGGSVVIMDSTISGNNSSGGAISSSQVGTYTQINNSTVTDNYSNLYVGGIDNIDGSSMVINNTTVSGNSNAGSYGGSGVYNGYTVPSTITINDSTITGNSVNGPGAGVWVQNGQGSINRSIISGNTGIGYANEVYNSDTLTVDGYNLFGHDGLTTTQAIAGFTPGPSDILATSDGTLPTALSDILDIILENNGGSTETHALTLASPALDGVADGSCAAGNIDQRFLPRAGGPGMGGPLCDIGAFELQNTTPTNVSLTGFSGKGNGGLIAGLVTAVLATLATLAAALHLRKPNAG